MLFENDLYGKVNKIQIAINRLKEFEPKDKPYILGFSGGKDSLVCYKLAQMAEVNFIAQHAPTPEFKETMQYIRKYFPDVLQVKPLIWKKSKNPKFNGKAKTMFNLIANRSIPPTRQHPYCCSSLKENMGKAGDTFILGVRSAESNARNNRHIVNFWLGKINVNPIVDWSDEEVWEFIKLYNLPYNPLYSKGHCRVGCPGCPKSKNQKEELENNPRWKKFYLTAFKHMLKNCDTSQDTENSWKTPEEVMAWWLGECENQREELEGQCEFMG